MRCWAGVRQGKADWLAATPRTLKLLLLWSIGGVISQALYVWSTCAFQAARREESRDASFEEGLAYIDLFYGRLVRPFTQEHVRVQRSLTRTPATADLRSKGFWIPQHIS